MPQIAPAFRITRRALTAAAGLTGITPPMTCSSVSIINRTVGDVTIATDDAGVEYAILQSGHERIFILPQIGPTASSFRKDVVGFWLSVASDGDVILIWS